ncbi:MAG TPA: DEAD/DEAH box helicase [Planctomycetota bacterium]|nr:DEAD/DEAH box helicase [Planctomycetota bacterium]
MNEYRGLRLYPFQEAAIAAIEADKSVIVSAPTGAGKTLVAEYAIERCIERGARVAYTSPIKALSNQKFRDFREKYGEKIGLMTGDVTLNGEAPVLIMTTEIFRNTLFEDAERMQGIALVIMDEIHYLGDDARGTVWEESILLAPERVRFVGLSATISNLDQFRQWVEKVRGHPVELVHTDDRPVPLTHLAWVPETGMCRISELKERIPEAKARRKARKRGAPDVLDHLQRRNELPCLFFCFSRRECEARARRAMRKRLLGRDEETRLLALFDDLGRRYEVSEHHGFGELRRLASHGVLFHHAGMMPIYKEIVERAFTTGLVKLLFTTETFALGVNMPARTVVFSSLRKFDGVGFDYLPTLNYYQMAGRAGRQGLDSQGLVYSSVDCDFDTPKAVKNVVFSRIEPLVSKFSLSYASILNLYARMGAAIFDAVDRSFAAFQRGGKAQAERAFLRARLDVLEKRGYLKEAALTGKGRFASKLNAYEIPIAELFWAGCFEELDPAEIAVLVSGLVFEARRGDLHERFESSLLGRVRNVAVKRLREFGRAEETFGLEPSLREPDFGLAAATQAWAQGARFEDLRNFTSVQDGDVVRNFRMMVQVIRQFAEAAKPHDALHRRLLAAHQLINRDEIDAERQLKLG